MAVSVKSYTLTGIFKAQIARYRKKRIKAARRLAVAAEYDLAVGTDVTAQEAFHGLLVGGFVLQPQGVFGIDGTLGLAVAQAELAVAVALIGIVTVL